MADRKVDSTYFLYEKLIQQKNITTYRVCKDTGVTNTVISQWKRGISKPKLENLIKIASYLGVSINYFIA